MFSNLKKTYFLYCSFITGPILDLSCEFCFFFFLFPICSHKALKGFPSFLHIITTLFIP